MTNGLREAVALAYRDALEAAEDRLSANGVEGVLSLRIEVSRRGDSAALEGSSDVDYQPRCRRCRARATGSETRGSGPPDEKLSRWKAAAAMDPGPCVEVGSKTREG